MEAVLFASGEPVEVAKLAETLSISKAACRELILDLQQQYERENRGITLISLEDRYQLAANSDHIDYIKKILSIKKDAPLTQAAMETLAIIAYNQPVTRGFLEQIRGVNCSQTVNTLFEKGLVEEAGRLNVPGRPITYRTTDHFLRSFDLQSLDELPAIPETEEEMQSGEVSDNEGQVSLFDSEVL